MTRTIIELVGVVVCLAGGWAIAVARRGRQQAAQASASPRQRDRRILLPFTGTSISERSLQAALRLALAEDATLMPAYLATVPRALPLDAAVPRQAAEAMPVLEAIEQNAHTKGVPVDARVQRGRTYRHALERLLNEEAVDRVIVSASGDPHRGLSGEDLVWLLQEAPAEVLILRPGEDDRRVVSGAAVAGHF
jgi:hypothetical protein